MKEEEWKKKKAKKGKEGEDDREDGERRGKIIQKKIK